MLIQNNGIDLIIVNGPPHRMMYYTCKVKELFPDIEIWSDFRDPWTWWYNLGYSKLSGSDRNHEEFMERYVMKQSDKIFTPVSEMTEYLRSKYPEFSRKIKTIPHAIDFDEIPGSSSKSVQNIKNVKLLYFGSLYLGLDLFYKDLVSSMEQNRNVTFDIYTGDHNYQEFIRHSDQIKTFPLMPSSELFLRVTNYDFFLLVFPEQFRNYFSTKFYELVALRIPIVYVGYKGETQRFIEENRLGLFFDIEDGKFFEWLRNPVLDEYNDQFEVEDYGFDKQTKEMFS